MVYTNENLFVIPLSRVYFRDLVSEIHYLSPLNSNNSAQLKIKSLASTKMGDNCIFGRKQVLFLRAKKKNLKSKFLPQNCCECSWKQVSKTLNKIKYGGRIIVPIRRQSPFENRLTMFECQCLNIGIGIGIQTSEFKHLHLHRHQPMFEWNWDIIYIIYDPFSGSYRVTHDTPCVNN